MNFLFSSIGAATALVAILLSFHVGVCMAEGGMKCENDKSFVFKTNKNGIELGCDHIAKRPEGRKRKTCKKTIPGGQTVGDKCPLACYENKCLCKNRKGDFKAGRSKKKITSCKGVSQDECMNNKYAAKNCPLNCNTCSDIMCDKPDMYGEPSLMDQFTKYSDMEPGRNGMYWIVEPKTETEQYLEQYWGTTDEYCPDTIDRFCVEKCLNEVENCDLVSAQSFYYENDCFWDNSSGNQVNFLCQFFNTQFDPTNFPMKLQPLINNPYGLVNGFSGNTYVAKSSPYERIDFVPSIIVPPGIYDSLPEGSPDFVDYYQPGVVCIMMNGGNTDTVDTCYDCVVMNSIAIGADCAAVAELTCQDGGLFGEGGSCTEACMTDTCLKEIQMGTLAVGGQYLGPADPFTPGPYKSSDLAFGCNMRDIFHPKSGEILDPYTCPPDAGIFADAKRRTR